jgi:hypothetical protein
LAVATCVLWLLGVEVLPNLHLATHDEHHTHAADGSILGDGDGDGDHDHDHAAIAEDHHHHHDHHGALAAEAPTVLAELAPDPHAPEPGDSPVPAIEHRSSGHAAAGIAHHAIALHRPPPPLLEPLSALRTASQIELAPDLQVSHAPLARPNARGPPAAV